MSNILPKIDYADGQILHGSDLKASNEVIKAGVDDNFARIQSLDLEKQDNLVADVNYLTPSTASETYEPIKGVDDFYVSNDEKIKLANTSGTNTGDETKLNIETKLEKANATNNGYLSKEEYTIFNEKQDKLVSGTNIKTINGNSVLGSGNIVIAGGGSGTGDVIGPISSIDGSIPIFDGITGKIIKDSGVTFEDIEATLPETPLNPESKFLNGNKQWFPIVIGSGGFASNIYMTNIISDLVPAYKKSSSINDIVETIVSATCNNNEVLAATYLYDTDLATEIVDAGSWRFNLFSAIDAAAGDSKFKVEVFERLANGTEIVLFSAYSGTIENRVGYEGYMYNMIETIQPSFNVNLTSRLGHRIYATTTAAGDRILSYKIGDGNASYLNTPLALRHSQLRDKNGEELYQHITQTEKDKLGDSIISSDGSIIDIINCTYAEYELVVDKTEKLFVIYESLSTDGIYYEENKITSLSNFSGDTPVGAINLWATNTAPTNWLICDGSAVSRTTYSDLFGIIGTTYGTGDGSTTFNLPNLKGKVPVGMDSTQTEFDTLGEIGGEKAHQLTVDEMPEHNHATRDYGTALGTTSANFILTNGGNGIYLTSDNTGGDQPHNNLQPYIVLNYIVRAFPTVVSVSTVEQTLDSNSTVNVPSVAAVKIVNDRLTTAEEVICNETDTYSASSTYALGSLVIYNSLLYKCTTAITVAESWNGAKWTQTNLKDEIIGLNGKVLWTNATPTVEFAGKSITLSETLANYKYYEVVYVGDGYTPKNYLTTGKMDIKISQLSYNYHYMAKREITAVSGTNITFADGKYFATYGSDVGTTSNFLAIPLKVIGYKN